MFWSGNLFMFSKFRRYKRVPRKEPPPTPACVWAKSSRWVDLKQYIPGSCWNGGVVTWAAACSCIAFAEISPLVAVPCSPLLLGLGLLRFVKSDSSSKQQLKQGTCLFLSYVSWGRQVKAGGVVPQSSGTYPVAQPYSTWGFYFMVQNGCLTSSHHILILAIR